MKKLPFLLVLWVIFTFSQPYKCKAQWYKSYGVNSIYELSEAQCKKAIHDQNKLAWYSLGATTVGGSIVYLSTRINRESSWDIPASLAKEILFDAGGFIAGMGGSLLVTTFVRKAHIKKVLATFPANVSLSPWFGKVGNHHSTGLALTIRLI